MSIAPEKLQNCKRAFERRFGQSVLPLKVFVPADERVVHVKDLETGTWAVYDVSAWRIRRLRDSETTDKILAGTL
jgi:hypothetical protein